MRCQELKGILEVLGTKQFLKFLRKKTDFQQP